MQELRQQLECHVHTIECMRSDNRAAIARHENVCVSVFSLFLMGFLQILTSSKAQIHDHISS